MSYSGTLLIKRPMMVMHSLLCGFRVFRFMDETNSLERGECEDDASACDIHQ